MRCRKCGFVNPDGSSYCSRCGTILEERACADEATRGIPVIEPDMEEEDVEVSPPLTAPAKGTAILVIKKGPDAGMNFTLESDVTVIGRHPESDIFLDDITVSRRHAEIRREGDSYFITDTGSLNGTYLNRERIDSAPLSSGDEIQIGKFKLLFLRG
ncbi:FHA domain-containing protein [Candidatus Solincola tengchongensis]|uniref:FHA domain-containing protein n=1 Tax=Candidatus Solincola tengchongensis TaxID=2900693 RepID=UPI002580B4F8|nr:FHA domain-containing protein [Candidatus Solincola tengchongensis]